MSDPYLYLVYPVYLIILIAVSVFFGWLGKKGLFLHPGLDSCSRISNKSVLQRFAGRLPVLIAALSILVYVFRVARVNIMEYNSLYTSNTMLAVNDQLIWYMSRTGRSFSPVYGVNYFFGHFKPVLYFFALIYKIKPGPETLLFVQALFLGAGAVAVYLIARKKFCAGNSGSFHSAVFTLAYLFAMTLISYTSFHTITLAVPFLLWAVYFIEKGSARIGFLFCVLALSCKENVAFSVFALGLYILLFRKDLKIRKSIGYCLMIVSLLWFYMTLYIIMPIFACESRTEFLREVNAIYSYLNPLVLLKTVFSFDRILYLFFLFLPFGFLPLFSPFSLIALPEIFLNVFSSNPAQARIFNYYSAIIMAVFFVASLEVVSRRKWLFLYLLSFSFFTLVFFGPSPEYKSDRHSRIGKEFLKAIPEDASVYSQVGLASHLSQREKFNIYLVDYNYSRKKDFSLKDYDYAVLDLKGDKFPDMTPYGERYFEKLKELVEREGMGLVKRENGFILLSRNTGSLLHGISKKSSRGVVETKQSNLHGSLRSLDRGLDRINSLTWRGIFIEEEPVTSPVLYEGENIGLIEADFPSQSKQGALFWLELGLVKLKEFSGKEKMLIEFRGRKQSFTLAPEALHGILEPSLWRKGEMLRHIETTRFSPFLWPGTYEIFFSLEDVQGGAEKTAFKIGEVLVGRR